MILISFVISIILFILWFFIVIHTKLWKMISACILLLHCGLFVFIVFFYNIDYYVDKYNVQCTHVIESEKCIFIKLQCQYDVAIEKAWHKKFVNYLLKKMFKKMRRSYKKNIKTFFIFHSWLNWKFLVHKQPLGYIITFPSIQSHL